MAAVNWRLLGVSSPLSYPHSVTPWLRSPPGRRGQLRSQRPIVSEQPLSAHFSQHKQRQLDAYRVQLHRKEQKQISAWRAFLVKTDGVQRVPAGKSRNETLFVPERGRVLGSYRFFSGGAAKPGWVVSKEHQFGPAIPDSAYYGEHATYSYFLMFIRGFRPYMEKAVVDCWRTIKGAVLFFCKPVATLILQHNPEFRLQLAAMIAFLATHGMTTAYFNGVYQHLVDISSLLELQKAQRYAMEGFWLSPSEQQEHRLQQYAEHHRELEHFWQDALKEATLARSFDVLVRFLQTTESEQQEVLHRSNGTAMQGATKHGGSRGTGGVPPTLLWSFSSLPYGRDDPHTQTFPVPGHEQPLRAFALSFTSNNISGSWGNYLDRQDNKNALMRPARTMFTDVLIPPTK